MFTYERDDSATELETYEWENVWWEHAEDKKGKRVLYIGDSISCGVRSCINNSNSGIYCDGFGSSKSLDNRFFHESIHSFALQQGYRSAVFFNNGLHGLHLSDDEYSYYYEKMLIFLCKEFAGLPIILLATTDYIGNKDCTQQVIRRNAIAHDIAEKYNAKYIDFFSLSVDNSNLHSDDGVHFNKIGYTLFSDCLLSFMKNELKLI